MESYSVEAILSAVDKNFSSTIGKAESSISNLDSKYDGAFQDKNGRWRAANGRFLTMKEQSEMLGKSFDDTAGKSKKMNTSILDIAKGIGVFKLIDKGIGLITSSVDGAIDRFDTLNKYPIVMQALGYTTDQVDKSMSKLTEGIDGLPTSLNEIVSNTQQLAISTGNLEKGTDTAIALNNAFLASGASTSDASRGMQQYVQMLSKGTVDMQSWRSIQETMPIAMDKVAKSFKDQGVNSVNELYDALQDGTITFDDFNNRLIKLNDGVGGFAELAKKNSAGIRTSFSNIKTAVVKGLANVITAIDEGMQNAGLGSIAENFDKIKNAVNVAFKAITDSIPPAISFLTNLWDTIKPFLPLIMAVIGYISIYQGVMGTARKAVELYNGAQKMMNVLMNLNPIGLIIAAVIALVAGFIYLWNTSEDFRNFWIGLWEGIKKAVGAAVDWIVSAWEGMKEFFSNTWNGLVDGTKNAVNSVKEAWKGTKQWFADLWTGIKDTAADMWDGVKQAFSDAVDGVVSAWLGVKQWFADLWKGIKSTVSSIVDSIKDAIMSRFGVLIYGIRNAFIHMKLFLSTLWENLGKIAGQMFEILKNIILAPVLFVTSMISGGWEEAKNNMIAVWNNILEAGTNIWSSIQAIFDSFLLNTKMAFLNVWTGIKAALSYIWTTISETAMNVFNGIVAYFVETWQNIKQTAIDSWESTKTAVAETWQNMKQGAIDLWNSVKQYFTDLWQSTKENAINTWKSIRQGVADAWENTKDAVVNTAKNIVKGAAQAWEDLKKGVSNAVESVKNTFDKIRQIDLLQIGKDIINGLINGITSKIEDVKNAVKDIAGSITGKIKDILNIHSPSRVMAQLGVFTSQGLAEGMLDGARYVDKASETLADRASNMDIGNRISAINSQIQTKVQHDVNYGSSGKPALFNIQLGNQAFQAFVDDISQAQGDGINLNLQF
ncbi:tape measure protein [Enterococcus gallinarum]|nr:tape measure protein [Enterococcus gallinarum]NYS82360.1 tape measure protein [Enterococcus gallinarum]PNY32721.1 tape measure protein [Enterococcus gallinarum]UXA03517.1 tape measure protein [Enterococcus gallinarum]